MEAVISEYIISVNDALMTMFFCLYIIKDYLQIKLTKLISIIVLLAIVGTALSLALSGFLETTVSFWMDFSIISIPFWLIVGFCCLSQTTNEPPSTCILVLLLSLQTLQVCRCTTLLIYGLFFPAMTYGSYCWLDIPGFIIPSLLLTFLLAKFCRQLFLKLHGLKLTEYIQLWVIPLFFLILHFLQGNLFPVDDNYLLANGLKLLVLLCAFITYSQTIWAISNAAKAAKEMETQVQIAHQLDLQRTRAEDLESHNEEMKHIRHDHRQHVQVLKGLLEKNNVQQALIYLDEYEGSISEIREPLCGNLVADALCRRYEILARQAGINTSIDVVLPSDTGIVGSDLAVILGNLWENAVAAAIDAEAEYRYIGLKIKTIDEQIMIRMENGYNGIIYQENERFLSSKPDRNKTEGVGLASIQAMAAKYGGLADFTYTANTFTASILLYIRNN